MKILVVGASGATGQHLVRELLQQGHDVSIVVRSAEKLPESVRNNPRLSFVEAPILNLSDSDLAKLTDGCHAVASCLGHNLTWKGMYGEPRKLVTDATRRLCRAIMLNTPDKPVRYVLMNTSGNRNRDLDEPISFAQKCVIGLLRLLLPPHVDNEKAADYLRTEIGQDNPLVEWCAVRPDNLIDEDEVTKYEVYPSPVRSAIFNAGKVSRINVAHFMAALMTNEELWEEWKGRMPVIYSV